MLDREKYMNASEVRQLRAIAEGRALLDLRAGRVNGPLAWMLVDLALSTGLRVSELALLTVEDIDRKRGSLRVTRLKRRKPLTESLPIGKSLVDHLKEFVAWRAARLRAMAPRHRRGLSATAGALLIGSRGRLTSQGLQRCWKSAVKRAGLPKELSVHCARHTLATHLLRKTGNLRLVQVTLGHSSPVVTANVYGSVSFEDRQNAVEGLYATG